MSGFREKGSDLGLHFGARFATIHSRIVFLERRILPVQDRLSIYMDS